MHAKLRAKRKELKLTQSVVAKAISRSVQSYCDKENGTRRFYKEEVDKLLKYFNCDYEDLFEVSKENEWTVLDNDIEKLKQDISNEADYSKLSDLARQLDRNIIIKTNVRGA